MNNNLYRVHSGCVKAVEEVDHVGSNREEYQVGDIGEYSCFLKSSLKVVIVRMGRVFKLWRVWCRFFIGHPWELAYTIPPLCRLRSLACGPVGSKVFENRRTSHQPGHHQFQEAKVRNIEAWIGQYFGTPYSSSPQTKAPHRTHIPHRRYMDVHRGDRFGRLMKM